MQTLKTAVVVVLLLFVLYGGYVALNGTQTPMNPDLEGLMGLDNLPDVSGPSGPLGSGNLANPSVGFDSFNSTPDPKFGANSNASPFGQSSTSPFPESKEFETSLPPLSPPSGGNASSGFSPLLAPSTPVSTPAQTNSTNAFPASPSSTTLGSNSNLIPALPPLPEISPSNISNPTNAAAVPVSTNTPGFGADASPKIPAELVSNSSFNSSAIVPLSPPPSVAQSDSVPKDLSEPLKETGPSSKSNSASKAFENAKELAMEQIERGQLKEGLATLSVFYNAPELTTEQRQDLLDLLDALASEVVFSRRHFLAMVYVVAPGETLAEIAKRNDVPADILARINAIDTKTQLPSGSKLKVVPGPFRAEVDLTRSELTLFLGDLYAGRYPVSFGSDPTPKPGTFQVVDKQQNKNYYGNGVQIPATDPRNPYGGWWMDLGSDYCIHGSPDGPTEGKLGCISLSPLDASDVFGMLGRGSPVTIRP